MKEILVEIFTYGSLAAKKPEFEEVLKTLVVFKKMELKKLIGEKITALKNKEWRGDGDDYSYGKEELYKEVVKVIENL